MTHPESAHACDFWRVVRGETDTVIVDNRSFVGVFETHPVNPGHALLIPQRAS